MTKQYIDPWGYFEMDEDALAEVIRRSYENEQGLKIRDDKRTARAVAEWLRGESR